MVQLGMNDKKQFQMDVQSKFDTIMSRESLEHQCHRKWSSLKVRYKRVIQKSVSEWFPFYCRVF